MRKSTADNYLILVALGIPVLSFLMGSQLTYQRQTAYIISRPVGDSTGPREYTTITDSMQMIEDCEETQLSSLGNSNFLGPVGVSKIQSADCGVPPPTPGSRNKNHYYLALSGYRMSNTSRVVANGDTFILKYVKEDSVRKNHHYGHYETKEIPVRYVKADPFARPLAAGYVLVPVSIAVYSILNITIMMIAIALALVGLYYGILRPLAVIANVSKGRMFGRQNTRNLRVAGRLFMAIAIAPLLFQMIFYFAIATKLPPEISLAFPQIFLQGRTFFVVAFIMLVLTKAFERGHKLENQNSSII